MKSFIIVTFPHFGRNAFACGFLLWKSFGEEAPAPRGSERICTFVVDQLTAALNHPRTASEGDGYHVEFTEWRSEIGMD